jgi:hypothetical protein
MQRCLVGVMLTTGYFLWCRATQWMIQRLMTAGLGPIHLPGVCIASPLVAGLP